MFVEDIVMIVPLDPFVRSIGFKYGIYFVVKELVVAFVDTFIVIEIGHGVILIPELSRCHCST